MRWLPLLALAGCAAPETGAPTRGSAATPVAVAPSDAGVDAPSDAGPTAWTISTSSVLSSAAGAGPVVTSNHSSSISAIAVSEDGKLAATSDGHSVRLWPSLDGKHEPVIVAMRSPLALAVAHDGEVVVIAGLDAIGQLELVRTNDRGMLLARTDLASDRPVRALYATGSGLFALRDDGGIAHYDLSGSLRGELSPNPREHVRTLAVRTNGVLSIVEADGKVHGQWIEVDDAGLHWGAKTPELPIRGEAVALSPDHQRIGATTRNAVVVLDVATAKVVDRFKNDDGFSKLHVIGFVDSSDLAFDKDGLLGELDGAYVPNWRENNVAASVYAIGEHVIVGGDSSLLVIAKKGEAAQYLGYQTMGPVDLVPRGNGFLVSNYTSLIEVGPDFRARRTIELGTHSGLLQNPLFVDGDHVVTAFAYGYENPQGVVFADIKSGTVTPLGDGYAFYNADSGILVLSRERVFTVRRYDRKKHAFGEPHDLDVEQGAQLAWLDPVRGDFAVVTVNRDATAVAIDIVRVRDKPEIVKSKTVEPGEDWFRTQDPQALFDAQPRKRRWNANKALVAEVHDGRLTLQDYQGTERWTVPATGITDVTWSARGDLVAFGNGIARVDLTTGALRERQCGWRFGLWDERPMSFTGFFSTAMLCEAP